MSAKVKLPCCGAEGGDYVVAGQCNVEQQGDAVWLSLRPQGNSEATVDQKLVVAVPTPNKKQFMTFGLELHMTNWGSRSCWQAAIAAVLSLFCGRGGCPCPLSFPCPRPWPFLGPGLLLVRKPRAFSRGHPLPKQCQALLQTAGGCSTGRKGPCWWRLRLFLGPFWRIFPSAGACLAINKIYSSLVFTPLLLLLTVVLDGIDLVPGALVATFQQ